MYIFFIHSPAHGHVGCIHVLAVVNSAAVHVRGACYLFKLEFSPDIFPGVGLQDLTSTLFLVFKKPPFCVPRWLHQFTFLPTVWEGSLFSTTSPALGACRLFCDVHSDWCEATPHCSFDLHFSDTKQCRASRHIPVGRLYVFCGEMSV